MSLVVAEQTVKTVEYPIGFVAQTVANNEYGKNVNVQSPDGIADILSLEIKMVGDFQANTGISARTNIGGNLVSCEPSNWITPNMDAPSYEVSFDCSNLVEQYNWLGGTQQFGFRTDKVAQNIYGTMKITYLNKPTVKLNVKGTEYQITDNDGKIFLQLLDENLLPEENATCYGTIYYPNNTLFMEDVLMNYVGENGLHHFDFNIPKLTGVYMVSAFCHIPYGVNFTINDTFECGTGNCNPSDWNSAWNLNSNAEVTTDNTPLKTYHLKLDGTKYYNSQTYNYYKYTSPSTYEYASDKVLYIGDATSDSAHDWSSKSGYLNTTYGIKNGDQINFLHMVQAPAGVNLPMSLHNKDKNVTYATWTTHSVKSIWKWVNLTLDNIDGTINEIYISNDGLVVDLYYDYFEVMEFTNATYGDAGRGLDLSACVEGYITFWAKANNLASNSQCSYQYYNGTDYQTLMTLSDGDDDNTYSYYSYEVCDAYGKSATSGIRVYGENLSINANCYLDDIYIIATNEFNETIYQTVHGSGEVHVNDWFKNITNDIANVPSRVWNYQGTITANILSQFVNAIWSYSGSIIANVLNQVSDNVWTRTDRNLTYTPSYPTPNNLTASQVWNYATRELTYYETVNLTLSNVSATVIASAVWNYDGTVDDNILNQVADRVQCYLNELLNEDDGEWGIDISAC
jgi:hypothetical protein